MVIKPGRMYPVRNWESIFGVQGARTIQGYERFDGRSKPSECNYAILSVRHRIVGHRGRRHHHRRRSRIGHGGERDPSTGSWAGGDAAGTLLLVACPASGRTTT